jgi:defect-in-organelle-trafficking protein DotD
MQMCAATRQKQVKMILRQKILAMSSVILLLSGCADMKASWNQPATQPVAAEPDVVTVKLAQAADKASRALDSIANIEQVKNPAVPPVPDDYANASPNMMQPVSIRWSGPIEQIGRVLADRAGLRFRVKGRQPGVPLVVNVDAYQQPILHVLRDIGLQAGNRADLAIDNNEGVIEVRYAAADLSR